MNKNIRIILLDDARTEFEHLSQITNTQIQKGEQNTKEIQLLNSINQKIEFIRLNPFYGDNISKKLIPKKYNVTNLWRVELFNYWRMLYTIKGDQIDIICFILDIVDHKKYDKTFLYRKK